jgi:hypothetical protein
MLRMRDRSRGLSHPSRLGLDARDMVPLAGNDMAAQACGRAYPILRTAVGVATLVHAFGV